MYIVKAIGNDQQHWRKFDMHVGTYLQILAEREATMAFNMGLQTAEGRRFLIEELRKQIARSNG